MPTYRVGVRLKAFDAGFGGVLRRAAGAAGRVGSAAQRAAGRGSSAFRRVAGDAAALGATFEHAGSAISHRARRMPNRGARCAARFGRGEVERGGTGPGVVDQSVHVTIHGSVYAEDRERLLDDLADRVRDA